MGSWICRWFGHSFHTVYREVERTPDPLLGLRRMDSNPGSVRALLYRRIPVATYCRRCAAQMQYERATLQGEENDG